MRTSSELSEPIAAYLGEVADQESAKGCLFPVVTRQGVPAVLYADSGEVDVDALELLAATAGAVLDSRPVAPPMPTEPPASAVDGLVNIRYPRLHRKSLRSSHGFP